MLRVLLDVDVNIKLNEKSNCLPVPVDSAVLTGTSRALLLRDGVGIIGTGRLFSAPRRCAELT